MAALKTIQGWDQACQPTIVNMAEALDKLRSLGCDLETGRCWIEVPTTSGEAALVARLFFSTAHGLDQALLDLPMLQGCRVWTTLGAPRYVSLEAFDQAEVDGRGSVSLQDGTSVHAVEFDTVTFPKWTELGEAIVWLTIKAFKAEHIFLRRYGPVIGIDYGILHIMREPNVKALAVYINENIRELSRATGKPPFGFVPTATIRRTLDVAGIVKVRGRRRRKAA